jgi:hypothetical protein
MKEEFWKNMKQMERIGDFGRRKFWGIVGVIDLV